ncbi:hypothetical protein GCM10010994_54820 [Chelatococcus reniformis]|uniref:Uncharacterized protein n=1 Tax=Chelatococcus reniformis TaxID=1494448 RepID=A0A916UWE1_9HYPH|nr:hypothetical protein GCM10010994_54820 [Chelatococcus reniformis]
MIEKFHRGERRAVRLRPRRAALDLIGRHGPPPLLQHGHVCTRTAARRQRPYPKSSTRGAEAMTVKSAFYAVVSTITTALILVPALTPAIS